MNSEREKPKAPVEEPSARQARRVPEGDPENKKPLEKDPSPKSPPRRAPTDEEVRPKG